MHNLLQIYHKTMWIAWLAVGNGLRRLGGIATDRGWQCADGPARRHFYRTQRGQQMIKEAGCSNA